MRVFQDIVQMKLAIPDGDLSAFDKLEARVERGFDQLESIYA
jgi:V/A-type H+-transporting ATPase subunit A